MLLRECDQTKLKYNREYISGSDTVWYSHFLK